jgi:hypothetical protein
MTDDVKETKSRPLRLKLILPELPELLHFRLGMKLINDGKLKFTKKDEEKLAEYLNNLESKELQEVAMRMIIAYSVDNYTALNRLKLVKKDEE